MEPREVQDDVRNAENVSNTNVINWPQKSVEIHNHHINSTNWNGFKFRDDDIIIATYGKSGTTLMQQLVGQLIFKGQEDVSPAVISPWLDLRAPPKEDLWALLEAQTHRRFIKSHLPLDALVFSPKAKYIYVVRDGRDACFSFHNHHAEANELWYQFINDTPGRVGPPVPPCNPDQLQYFRDWLHNDGVPLWPFFSHIRSWWEARHLPNVLLVHFADLVSNFPQEARRVAAFLGIAVEEQLWPLIEQHCSLDWMRAHGEKIVPAGGAVFKGGASSFLHKGTNGRWRDVLTAEDVREYEERALKELGPECAAWLAAGGRIN